MSSQTNKKINWANERFMAMESTDPTQFEKKCLRKLVLRLRKLPQKCRDNIMNFITEEREHGAMYLCREIYNSLTGENDPSNESILLTWEDADKRKYQEYVPHMPYMPITGNKKARQEFWNETFLSSITLLKMPDDILSALSKLVTKPHTNSEKINLALEEYQYNTNAAQKATEAHRIAMRDNPAYRTFIETQTENQRG